MFSIGFYHSQSWPAGKSPKMYPSMGLRNSNLVPKKDTLIPKRRRVTSRSRSLLAGVVRSDDVIHCRWSGELVVFECI